MKYTIATHNGPFHADDVIASVLMGAWRSNVEVVRTRDQDVIDDADIVVDVGSEYNADELRLDHHQPDFGRKHPADEEGNVYSMASAGLALEQSSFLFNRFNIGDPAVEEQAKEMLREELIRGVDAADNGEVDGHGTVSELIAGFNPEWDEDVSFDEKFSEALDFALGVLDRKVKHILSQIKAEQLFRDAETMFNGQVKVLQQYLPWTGMETPKELLYVVFPASGGGYRVQQVPEQPGGMAGRKPLPEAWVEDAPSVEGGDAVFVHSGRFIAGTTTEAAAIDMARQAVAA